MLYKYTLDRVTEVVMVGLLSEDLQIRNF